MGEIIDFHQKDQVITMCKIIKKLYNKSAEQLLKEHDVYDTLPVDLEKMTKSIGISVLSADFSELEKAFGKDGILGMVRTDGDNAAIFYKQDDSEDNVRFTIAHELAHCCNLDPENCKEPHIEYRTDDDKKDDMEKQMDIFAAELLMPLHKIEEVYLSNVMLSSIIMARLFKVPISVVEARLNHLKISYFNKKGRAVVYE